VRLLEGLARVLLLIKVELEGGTADDVVTARIDTKA